MPSSSSFASPSAPASARTKSRRAGLSGSGTGGSGTKKTQRTAQYQFQSITVLKNDGRGTSTTKTIDAAMQQQQSPTLTVDGKGVHAGVNWTVRHKDLDYDYLVHQAQAIDEEDDNLDNDDEDGTLIIRSADGTKQFDCHALSSTDLADLADLTTANDAEANPRVRQHIDSKLRQFRTFVRDVVKIHEKRWRAKHHVDEDLRPNNRTSGRNGGGIGIGIGIGSGRNRIGSMGRTGGGGGGGRGALSATTTTTTMTATMQPSSKARSVTPTPYQSKEQRKRQQEQQMMHQTQTQIQLSSPTRRVRTYGGRGRPTSSSGRDGGQSGSGQSGRGGSNSLDKYLPSPSPSRKKELSKAVFSPRAPRNATPTKIRSLRDDGLDDDDDDDEHGGGMMHLDEEEEEEDRGERNEPTNTVGKKLFSDPEEAGGGTAASAGEEDEDADHAAHGKEEKVKTSGGSNGSESKKIGRRLLKNANTNDDDDVDSDVDFGGGGSAASDRRRHRANTKILQDDDDDDDDDNEEERPSPKKDESKSKSKRSESESKTMEDSEGRREEEGDDDGPSPKPSSEVVGKGTTAANADGEEESNPGIAVSDEEEIAVTPRGSNAAAGAVAGRSHQDITSFFVAKKATTKAKAGTTTASAAVGGSSAEKEASQAKMITPPTDAAKKKDAGAGATATVATSAADTEGAAAAIDAADASKEEEMEKDAKGSEMVDDGAIPKHKISSPSSTWGSSLSPSRPNASTSGRRADDDNDDAPPPALSPAETSPPPLTRKWVGDMDVVMQETTSRHFVEKDMSLSCSAGRRSRFKKPVVGRVRGRHESLGSRSRLERRSTCSYGRGRDNDMATGEGYGSCSDEDAYVRSDTPPDSAQAGRRPHHHQHRHYRCPNPSLSGTPTRNTKRAAAMDDYHGSNSRPSKRMRRGELCSTFYPARATSSADLALGRPREPCSKVSRRLNLDNAYATSQKKAKWRNGRWGNGNGAGPDNFKDNVAVGLQNMGNTCYLNSSLQMLFSVPGFASDLASTYDAIKSKQKEDVTTNNDEEGNNDDNKSPLTMPLATSLLYVARALNILSQACESSPTSGGEGEGKATEASDDKLHPQQAANGAKKVARPLAVKKAMDALTDKFAGFEQRDAHEFLSDLIDMLHDELAAASKSLSSSTPGVSPTNEAKGKDKATADIGGENDEPKKKEGGENNGPVLLPTDKYFRLDVKVCLTCDSCGYARSKEELYRHLSLDVGDDESAWSVERGLEQFFGPERREIKCEKCADGKTATQVMEIIQRPKALVLHLKRFIVTHQIQNTATKASDKENQAKNEQKNDTNDSSPPPLLPSRGDDKTPQDAAMEIVFRKNKARVVLHETISIDSFCADGTVCAKNGTNYHALSVVHHIGGTACSGHYTTDARRTLATGLLKKDKTSSAEAQWVDFDDSMTVQTTPEHVLNEERSQRNAYLTMYICD